MRFYAAATAFDKRVRASAMAVEALGVADGVAVMVAFYREDPVTGIAVDGSG